VVNTFWLIEHFLFKDWLCRIWFIGRTNLY